MPTPKAKTGNDLMDKLLSLCKRRGFIFPGSEIYGGLANSWDYGPLGAELKKNIKDEWWNRFVRQRTDVVGIDAALMMNPKVWEASGHVAGFSDPLVECKKCHERFRADALEISKSDVKMSKSPVEMSKSDVKMSKSPVEISKSRNVIPCPSCGGELMEAKQFNLMFKTNIGPTEEKGSAVYLRPETAQAMFVDFKNVLDTTRKRLPFGIAQMGKAFRNEITPGNFIFRTREFEQMEIEYFVKESEWEKHFENWLGEMKAWLEHLGVSEKNLHYAEIPDGERAHYSKRTVDIEYEYPFGRKELYGLAYRGNFDLTQHEKFSGQDLRYTDPNPPAGGPKEKFLPHVIEPTWGVDRSVLVAMLEAYHEEKVESSAKGGSASGGKSEKLKVKSEGEEGEDIRVVMRFPKWLAPVKVAILPLSKKEELAKVAKPLYEELAKKFVCEYDETQSIGKRYRRQDEIGTPYCVTVDFDSLEDKAVTVRDRDTMEQDRIKISELVDYLGKSLEK
ncbi:MAG: glycine--tRNA ligase [bacterium]|nr:glycine--tRNA ligase [bacterium]